MTEWERMSEGGNFLKAKHLDEYRILALRIVSEGAMSEHTFDDGSQVKRVQVDISYDGQTEESPNKWGMNAPSLNALIDILGANDTGWRDIDIPVVAHGTGTMRHVKVHRLQLQANVDIRMAAAPAQLQPPAQQQAQQQPPQQAQQPPAQQQQPPQQLQTPATFPQSQPAR